MNFEKGTIQPKTQIEHTLHFITAVVALAL